MRVGKGGSEATVCTGRSFFLDFFLFFERRLRVLSRDTGRGSGRHRECELLRRLGDLDLGCRNEVG
eukprot:TRINITY_DN1654_c0_g1_i1.p2 TRINITY_DN1654_c0_g1~~TRINITY_DN1654_c0_g1_i1.p2  ORF type:complete len:66 (-),score=6.12 TRINITY_DN1654_c0_g1_i1:438-635(-)